MKESKKICVHLTTGFAWLTSIETTEETSEERALEIAVAYAIKNDLKIDYYIDGSDEHRNMIDYCSIEDQTDEETMEMCDYMYLDLSEYDLPNIWVSMRDTRIDHTVYNNTVSME